MKVTHCKKKNCCSRKSTTLQNIDSRGQNPSSVKLKALNIAQVDEILTLCQTPMYL